LLERSVERSARVAQSFDRRSFSRAGFDLPHTFPRQPKPVVDPQLRQPLLSA
jgi:hypothetical protein